MALKIETVSQFDGFGNKRPSKTSEHYRSANFTFSQRGMVAGFKLFKWYFTVSATYPQFSQFGAVNHFAVANGHDLFSGGGTSRVVYFLNERGEIWGTIAGAAPFPQYPHFNSSHFNTGYAGGLIGDQKGRLLFPGYRFLGMWDSTIGSTVTTATLTNGAKTVVRTAGTSFVSTNAKQYLIIIGATTSLYLITSYTDGDHVTLASNFDQATGSYSFFVVNGMNELWKDFGANYNVQNAEGGNQYIACETYEGTVLFGRNNLITSLDIATDTVTTDSVPAFNMPSGYNNVSIHRGSNGVLMGFNNQGKGVLVLWDNYSDRSIAPWIILPDRLISLTKYNGGWIAVTARALYFTNGYTLELLSDSFLDMGISPMAAQVLPQTSFVVDNILHFITDFSPSGKRRAGIMRFNIKTRMGEFISQTDMDAKTQNLRSIFYNSEEQKVYAGETAAVSYLKTDTAPVVSTFITNPVGQGEDVKYANGVKLDIGVSPTYSTPFSTFSTDVIVKICPMNTEEFAYGQVKTTSSNLNEVIVDEAVMGIATIGDEIEFLTGVDCGYTRNITARTGTAGGTVTYTLDRVLPSLPAANDYIFRTHFQLVSKKTFTNIVKFNPETLFFATKNRAKAQSYLVKIELENATVPLEIRPLQFTYEDFGAV